MEIEFKEAGLKGLVKGKMYKIYRQQFNDDLILLYEYKRDELIEQISLEEISPTPGDMMSCLGTDFLAKLAYASLKAANPDLPGIEEYTDEIEDYQAYINFGLGVFEAIFTASIPAEPEPKTPAKTKKKAESRSRS